MSLPFAIASSMRRTELSRATASGMNEFGKRTVSRSGRIGSSDGIESGRSPIESSSGLRFSRSVICSYQGAPVGEIEAPPPAEPQSQTSVGRRVLHVEEQRRGAAAALRLTLFLLGGLACLFAVLAADRERQRAETLLGNLLAALVAETVVATLETRE